MYSPMPIKPHRMARGYVLSPNGDGTHFLQNSLYNDATDGSYLVVLNFDTILALTGCYSKYVQGTVGTFSGRGVPIMTGIAQLPGALYKDNQGASTVALRDYIFENPNADAPPWVPFHPFAVISPGWSLVIVGDSTSGAMHNSFFWQVWRDYEIQQWQDRDL